MNNSQSIINFMYFANNFSRPQLEQIFESLGNYNHFKSKFNIACDEEGNGTKGLLKFFMQLSRDKQTIVCNYVNTNYDGCGFKKVKEEAAKTFEETTDYITPIIGQLTTQLEKTCIALKL